MPIHQLHRLDDRKDLAGDTRVSVQIMVALVPHESARDAVSETVRRRFPTGMGSTVVVGTADELADHFAGLRARGVERFYVWFTDFAPPDTLRRFGEITPSA